MGVETLNLEAAGLDELEAALDRCSGFVLGSPTLGGHMPTQVQTALGTIIRNANARQVPCSVFGSFGWSGEAVDKMEQRLKVGGLGRGGQRAQGASSGGPCQLPPPSSFHARSPPHPLLPQDAGFRIAFDPIRCKFKPTAQTLQLCEESGLDLAQARWGIGRPPLLPELPCLVAVPFSCSVLQQLLLTSGLRPAPSASLECRRR